MSEQHRAPRDLQDLLRLAVEHQVARAGDESVDTPSAETPSVASDPERASWLNEALNSLQNDPVSEMKKGIAFLSEGIEKIQVSGLDEKFEEEFVYTLDTLVDYVGSIDYANDFIKLNGLKLITPLLNIASVEIKSKACDVFAEIVQNNPNGQKAAIETDILQTLTDVLDSDQSEQAKIKSLYAISCLIRDNRQAAVLFDKEHDGLSVLLRAMQRETETHKLRIKSSFLITALAAEVPEIKETLFKMGLVEQLVGLLHTEHNASHEYLLSALNAIITDNAKAVQECRRQELGLQDLLKTKLFSLANQPEFAEERYFATEVLRACFPNSDQVEEER